MKLTWKHMQEEAHELGVEFEEMAEEIIRKGVPWMVTAWTVEKSVLDVIEIVVTLNREYTQETEMWSRQGREWVTDHSSTEECAVAYVTFTVTRIPKCERLTFKVEWELGELGTAEYPCRVKSGSRDDLVTYLEIVTDEGGRWWQVFSPMVDSMSGQLEDVSVCVLGNEPDWDSMPGGHDCY
jgi:hypothetical protein